MKLLSAEEIKQRLIRLRNLEQLHIKARERITFLERENKHLKQRIKELEEKDKDKNQKIEAMAFQLEQIKNKLFGKKPIVHHIVQKREKKARNTSSYQRPIPTHGTETKLHLVSACAHCRGKLKRRSSTVFFEEDIPLPIPKIVIKHEVEVGYCSQCRRQSSGIKIPSKKAILGENVKKYVCILSIVNRMSHAQIKDHLSGVFCLNISIGEIGNILQTEANHLRSEYQGLRESVLNQTGTHYDETGWKVQKEEQGKYAWVAAGTENNDTVFSLGRSRGKGNITDIGVGNVGITDDYGAYRNAFAEHQLCWAHPQRKLKEVAESSQIPEEKREHCKNAYIQFSRLYKQIGQCYAHDMSSYLKRKYQTMFRDMTECDALDPPPLAALKKSLRRNKEKYFTFLTHPGIPIDNNKAERALRHLVIKRKISFGSKTQRGAETTSILASVILSLKWNDPQHWFQKYLKLGT